MDLVFIPKHVVDLKTIIILWDIEGIQGYAVTD